MLSDKAFRTFHDNIDRIREIVSHKGFRSKDVQDILERIEKENALILGGQDVHEASAVESAD